jgi:hypothetical protein
MAVAPVLGQVPRRVGRGAPHPRAGGGHRRCQEEARGRGERAEERGEAAGRGRDRAGECHTLKFPISGCE